MQALLDDLRKDLDMVAAGISIQRNKANQERRKLYRMRQDYEKVLIAVRAVEDEIYKGS